SVAGPAPAPLPDDRTDRAPLRPPPAGPESAPSAGPEGAVSPSAGAAVPLPLAGPGRPGRETSRGPDGSPASGPSAGPVLLPLREPERDRPPPARALPGAGDALSVRSTASPPSPPSSASSSSVSEESAEPGPADDGRRRLRPPRDPRRRRLRTTTPSSPPPSGAGPPSPWSGRATATGSSEAGRASGTPSSDMEPFRRVARRDGAPAPASRHRGRRGAQSRMVTGAVGALVDL